jgi:hypothetical protein
MISKLRFLACTLLVGLPLLAHASLTVVPRDSKDNTDFPGHDIRSLQSESAMHCSEVCGRTKACVAWTWVRPGVQGPSAVCYLKDSAPDTVRNRCCMSGLKDTKGGYERNIDRPGGDYNSFDLKQADPGLCESACTRDKKCRAWTYVNPGVQGPTARCWLKNAVPNPVANRCCTSAVKP